MEPKTFLIALIVSVTFVMLLVAGRFLWAMVVALRAHSYGIGVLSIAGLATILGLFSAVIIVWFGYAVAHTGKNNSTDLTVLLMTAPPFFIASIGLWLMGGKLHSRLRAHVIHRDTHADADRQRG